MKWTTRPIADVADFCLGKMLDEKKNKGDSLPYLANINVRWGEFDLDNLREMRFEQNEMDRYGLKYGDIVMCEGGEPGRCAIWKDSVQGMMIQKALHRIRPHDCIDHRFLFYSLLHKGKLGGFVPLLTGATIKHLPREKLAKVEIAFPKLELQCCIAAILSAYDDLIENNRQRMALLEDAARQLYREWFVRLRFPGHEHTRIINGVPDGWERKTLGDLAEITMGQSPESQYYNEVGDGLPFHQGVADFGDRFVSHRVYCTVRNRVAEAGDILCSVRAPVGRLNITFDRIVIGRGLASLRSKFNRQSLLFQQLRAHFFKEDLIGTGAIFASVTKKEFETQELLDPTVKIANAFEEISRPIDEKIGLLVRQNEKLRAARDLLLPRLMNGAISV
jgi:type I restriction enzyme S subunit